MAGDPRGKSTLRDVRHCTERIRREGKEEERELKFVMLMRTPPRRRSSAATRTSPSPTSITPRSARPRGKGKTNSQGPNSVFGEGQSCVVRLDGMLGRQASRDQCVGRAKRTKGENVYGNESSGGWDHLELKQSYRKCSRVHHKAMLPSRENFNVALL